MTEAERNKAFAKACAEMIEAEMVETIAEVAQETCMKSLREKDGALKLSNGRVKELYDSLIEQFILTYIEGKSLWMIMDDLESGKFYNTWSAVVVLQVGKLLRQR